MKKCPYCAERIQDEAIVCRYCGRDLVASASVVVQNRQGQSEKNKSTVHLAPKYYLPAAAQRESESRVSQTVDKIYQSILQETRRDFAEKSPARGGLFGDKKQVLLQNRMLKAWNEGGQTPEGACEWLSKHPERRLSDAENTRLLGIFWKLKRAEILIDIKYHVDELSRQVWEYAATKEEALNELTKEEALNELARLTAKVNARNEPKRPNAWLSSPQFAMNPAKAIATREVALRIAASVAGTETRKVPRRIAWGSQEGLALQNEIGSMAKRIADQTYPKFRVLAKAELDIVRRGGSGSAEWSQALKETRKLEADAVQKAVGDDDRFDSYWQLKLEIAVMKLMEDRFLEET